MESMKFTNALKCILVVELCMACSLVASKIVSSSERHWHVGTAPMIREELANPSGDDLLVVIHRSTYEFRKDSEIKKKMQTAAQALQHCEQIRVVLMKTGNCADCEPVDPVTFPDFDDGDKSLPLFAVYHISPQFSKVATQLKEFRIESEDDIYALPKVLDLLKAMKDNADFPTVDDMWDSVIGELHKAAMTELHIRGDQKTDKKREENEEGLKHSKEQMQQMQKDNPERFDDIAQQVQSEMQMKHIDSQVADLIPKVLDLHADGRMMAVEIAAELSTTEFALPIAAVEEIIASSEARHDI